MSGKNEKALRRTIKRNQSRLLKQFIDEIKSYNLLKRLAVAWAIVKGKK